MDLALLETFVAVSDELHFGRAATRLGLAQPQVSQRISRLEKDLGVRLFERNSQGVRRTPAGDELAEMARAVVTEHRVFRNYARTIRDGIAGTLRVGSVGSAFFGPLTTILGSVREALPDVTLKLVELESPDQVAALRDGTLDIGMQRPPTPADLGTVTVWREPLIAAVATDSPWVDGLDATDLAASPIVLFERESGPGYWDLVAQHLSRVGADLRPAAKADHVTTMLGQVALGAGVALVPASTKTIIMPGVRYVTLTEAPVLRLCAVTRRGDLNPALRRALAILGRPGGAPPT